MVADRKLEILSEKEKLSGMIGKMSDQLIERRNLDNDLINEVRKYQKLANVDALSFDLRKLSDSNEQVFASIQLFHE